MIDDVITPALATLAARLAEHYVPPPREFLIDLCISDHPYASRRFVMGPSIGMFELGLAPEGSPAARITISPAVLDFMLADPVGFDPRSAFTLSLGGVRVEGIARSAAYWLQLLKRPSPVARDALERARTRAPESLASVATIDARDQPDWKRRVGVALDTSTPLKVRGVIDWPEASWTLAQWRDREGDMILRADPATGRPQSVAGFIDSVTGTRAPTGEPVESVYTDGCLLPPAWDSRFRIKGLPDSMFGPAQLWFGQRREDALVTRLHCDVENSFLAQVLGSKRVRLFSPREERRVYALDAFNTYRPCRVDAGAPDFDRFPLFREAQFVDVISEPGDLLIIPTGWFHCVWALDHTLSVSRFAADNSFA